MNCKTCSGDGGWLENPDYPMGDCGDRVWYNCPDCDNPSRKNELFADHVLIYNHKRFGSPLPDRLKGQA